MTNWILGLTTFLFAWTALYLLHWHIIRPAILLRLRYSIFEARDKLRLLVIKKRIPEQQLAFPILEQRCRFLLEMMEDVNLVEFFSIKVPTATSLRVSRDWEIINAGGEEVIAIYKEMLYAMMGALTVNSPFVVVLASPVAAILFIFSLWARSARWIITKWFPQRTWGMTYVRSSAKKAACA